MPVWLQELHQSLEEADFISLTVAIYTADSRSRKSWSPSFDLWRWFDSKVFARDTAARRHSEVLIDFSPESFSELNDGVSAADLMVWMAPDRPPSTLISAAGIGVWTVADAFSKSFGYWEIANREPATRCSIIDLGSSSDEDRIVASTFAATDSLSLARGIGGLRTKCEALLLSTIGREFRSTAHHRDGLPDGRVQCQTRTSPGFLSLFRGLLGIYGRYLVGLPTRPFFFDQWQLAYRLGGDRFDQGGLKRLAPSHNGFWADPFIAHREGQSYIIFEEYLEETSRGHIAAIEVQPDGEVGEAVDVLIRDCHLSYPFLFDYEGDLYMVPESAEAGRVEAFRCTQFPDVWEHHAVLLDGVSAFDSTLIEHDGRWWMFNTIQHDGNSTDDELHLFHAATPFGEWTPHPMNPVRLDVRAARPAGALFRHEGKLFRPAQDCSGRYGSAIAIHEVLCMTPDLYEESEALRISADWAADAHATHTMNQSHGVTVYDCEVRRRK